MNFNELVDEYLKLDETHTQERKTLERKHKLEMDELLAKQHNAKKEVKLSSFFHVGDTIAIGEVEWLPTTHQITSYNILSVADDYMVAFDSKALDTRLILWEDLISAEKLFKNGEELLVREDAT